MKADTKIKFTPNLIPYVTLDSKRFYLDLADILACLHSIANGESECILYTEDLTGYFVTYGRETFRGLAYSLARNYRNEFMMMIEMFEESEFKLKNENE